MGQKVNPVAFRLGQTQDWSSLWYNKKSYREFLKQDITLRDFLTRKLLKAGVCKIKIERSGNIINVIIKTARPGLIIGRGGGGIEQLKDDIKRIVMKGTTVGKTEPGARATKFEIRLEVEEIKAPESYAAIAAQNMAEQIEKRLPFRRVLKQTLEKILQTKEVKGAKIMMKGRLGGAEIARTEWLAKGSIPLHTLRAIIDYAQATAYTTYGTVGIKVWVYKGEMF